MNMINYKKLAEHGALIDNADFIMLKCNFCGKLALYDEERALLYLNPQNLSAVVMYGVSNCSPVYCPCCKHENSFEEIDDNDKDKILNSEWAFIFQ